MRCVDMGLNTEPWNMESGKRKEKAILLKTEIEKIMEDDGECRLSWSCEGRTRHEMHSNQWMNALKDEHPDWEWTIGYNYECTISKN